MQPNPDVKKRPIHFVIDSLCQENLSALLCEPNVNVDAEHSSLTPVNILVEQISDSNFNKIIPCIKLLVKHCANVNIPDRNGVTPIIKILQSKQLNAANKQAIVEHFLVNAIIDIDSAETAETVRKLTKIMPDSKLPPVQNEKNQNWSFSRFMACLQAKNETDFLKGINFIAVNNPNYLEDLISINGNILLMCAAEMGLSTAVEQILRLGVDINVSVKTPTKGFSAVDYASICGHYDVLEILLQSPRLICTKELVSSFMIRPNDIGNKSDRFKYEKCFQLLLNHPNIDVNGEICSVTLLHEAILYNNSDCIDVLLGRGAYIGITNHWGCSISNMNSRVLEKHFDRCITATHNEGIASPELTFCYQNLVPTENMRKNSEAQLYEMTAVELLSKSKELRHLIKHPLIMSFFWLKWKRLAPFFYINLFFCASFAVTSVSYIIFCYLDNTEFVAIQIVTLLLMIYFVAREIVQLIFSPRIYLTSFDNYVECALIVLVLIILFDLSSNRRAIAAITIILMASAIFVLVGSLPIQLMAVHIVMLETVAKNFLKCLSLYSSIIIAFALSFYTLFHEPLAPSTNSTILSVPNSDGSQIGREDEYNKFSSIGLSILKTIVMTIGELDAGSIDFANATSYFIFVVFIFSVTTVLANLLNGLAVSDINAVKSEAKLLYLIRCCQVLARYEKVFWNTNFCVKFPSNLFRAFDSDECQVSIKTKDYRVHTNGIDREIIDGAFNKFAKHKAELDDEMEKETFQSKISTMDAAIHSLGTDNRQLNERMSNIENTLTIICDNLIELTKK